MKHRMISMVAGLLLASLLPLAANAQEWRTTSTLKETGSDYNSQVTFVGAEKVSLIPMRSTSTMMATCEVPTPSTESSTSTHNGGRRRSMENPGDAGETGDESSPIGEPWVLLLFAAAAAAVIAVRNRRHAFGKKD
ncbi:MAG: hypothetical protein J5823_05370 [Paludibacteraceae bacterium]|nr:hypothetical protein [Paludibacteraceae bacterium]